MSADEFVIIDLRPQRDTEVTEDVITSALVVIAIAAQKRLTPPEMAKAWRAGLKAAGAANVKRAYLGGISLPMVVEFDCPEWHAGDHAGTFAKVRLLVAREGWVTRYEGLVLENGLKPGTASCTSCAVEGIHRWLLTCPPCLAGEDIETHPEHGRFFEDVSGHDKSPLAFVLSAVMRAAQPGRRVVNDDEPRVKWTAETAAAWLDDQTDEDGAPLVPETVGQARAYEIVQHVEGRPTQGAIREAQALRKARTDAP